MFTHQEIDIAKQVRATILKENVDELKAVYMAGEINMWAELKSKNSTQELINFVKWYWQNVQGKPCEMSADEVVANFKQD